MLIRFGIPTGSFWLDMEMLKSCGVTIHEAPMHAARTYLELGNQMVRHKSVFFAYDGVPILEYVMPRTTVSPLAPQVEDDTAGKALSDLNIRDELYTMLVRVLFPHLSPSQYMDMSTRLAVEASSFVMWHNYIDLLGMCSQGMLIVIGQDKTAERQYDLPGFVIPEPGTHGY